MKIAPLMGLLILCNVLFFSVLDCVSVCIPVIVSMGANVLVFSSYVVPGTFLSKDAYMDCYLDLFYLVLFYFSFFPNSEKCT